MSKINAIRIVNLNYNHNSMKVIDETFDLAGLDTLVSLENGQGKSVLIQIISSLFVDKRYRDMGDRALAEYFTTTNPTFVMVEWKLDDNAGYVLTGSMVRANPRANEEGEDALNTINFITFYKEPSPCSLSNLEVIENNGSSLKLKSFSKCKKMFEGFRSNRKIKFNYYDMTIPFQSRKYFSKLEEYGIFKNEWQKIMHKVNSQESGLSELFADCKTTKRLFEEWFFPAIEAKLNENEDKIANFQSQMSKYVSSYKDNKDEFEARDKAKLYLDKLDKLKEKAQPYLEAESKKNDIEQQIGEYKSSLVVLHDNLDSKLELLEGEIDSLEQEKTQIEYEKQSFEINRLNSELEDLSARLNQLNIDRDNTQSKINDVAKELNLLEARYLFDEYQNLNSRKLKLQNDIDVYERENEELKPRVDYLGGCLKTYYSDCVKDNTLNISKLNDQLEKKLEIKHTNEVELSSRQSKLDECVKELAKLEGLIEEFDSVELNFNKNFNASFRRNLLNKYDESVIAEASHTYSANLDNAKSQLDNLTLQRDDALEKLVEWRSKKVELLVSKANNEASLRTNSKTLDEYENELAFRNDLAKALEFTGDVFDLDVLRSSCHARLERCEASIADLANEKDNIEKEINKLSSGETVELSDQLIQLFKQRDIHYTFGMSWLTDNPNTIEDNKKLVSENPFIPYSLIVDDANFNKLKNLDEKVFTSYPIPIVLRSSLQSGNKPAKKSIIVTDEVSFYCLFNDSLLDKDALSKRLEDMKNTVGKLKDKYDIKTQEKEKFYTEYVELKNQGVTKSKYDALAYEIESIEAKLQDTQKSVEDLFADITNKENFVKTCEQDLIKINRHINMCVNALNAFNEFRHQYDKYLDRLNLKDECESDKKKIMHSIDETKFILESLTLEIKSAKDQIDELSNKRTENKDALSIYDRFDSVLDFDSDSIDLMQAEYLSITDKYEGDIKQLRQNLEEAIQYCNDKQGQFNDFVVEEHLNKEEVERTFYSKERRRSLKEQRNTAEEKLERFNYHISTLNKDIASKETTVEMLLDTLKKELSFEEPLDMSLIENFNFDERIENVDLLISDKSNISKQKEKFLGTVQRSIDKFSQFNCVDETDDLLVKKLNNYDIEQLNSLVDELLIKHKRAEDQNNKERDATRFNLSLVRNMQELDLPRYKDSLLSIESCLQDSTKYVSQIEQTITIISMQLKSIEINLQSVEGEKEVVIDLLSEHLENLCDEILELDKLPTVEIGGLRKKMLEVKIRSFQEDRGLHKTRVSQYVDELTAKAYKCLVEGSSHDDYIKANLNSKTLFEKTIGLNKISVKVLKVEPNRSLMIDWAEVMSKSGAERFLSSFIMLSALMCYLRSSELDYFGNRNEGKVLLMDNPFGQTNAAHILEPLMQLANKTDIQLICLTGIRDEAIYNCFDNIYVLNLIPTGLSGGSVSVMKSEHRKGDTDLSMSSIHLEVEEQLDLGF